MERRSIQELAAVLTAKSGLKKKEAERFATTIFDVVKESLLTDRIVKIKGLGTFKIIDIESRESINVNTGERMLIEGHNKITFTPDTTMKELVNRPFSQFETVILNDGVDFDDFNDQADITGEAEDSSVGEDIQDVASGDELEEKVSGETVEENIPVETVKVEEKPVETVSEEEALEDVAHSIRMRRQPPIEVVEVSYVENEEKAAAKEKTEEAEENQTEAPAQTFLKEEPSSESAQESEQEHEIESEPESEPETEIEKAPEFQKEQEKETEGEQKITAEADNDEEDGDEPYYGIEPKKKKRNYWQWLLILIGALLCFILGYMLGMNHGSLFADEIVTEDVLSDSTDFEVPIKDTVEVTEKEVVKDTVKVDSSTVALKPETEAEPKEELKPEPQEKPKEQLTAVTSLNPVVDYRKYEKMDARVRTGAYRIVGTQEEVKVKAGETLRLLAKRYLGPGMECYIEVYNGLNANSQLKEGQTIKIPELKIKNRHK